MPRKKATKAKAIKVKNISPFELQVKDRRGNMVAEKVKPGDTIAINTGDAELDAQTAEDLEHARTAIPGKGIAHLWKRVK